MIIPRFRGRAFEIEGGWSWEMLLTAIGHDQGHHFKCQKVFKTKDEAIKSLKDHVKDSVKLLSEEMPELNISAATYVDMQTDEIRRWDKLDEH